MWVWVLLAGVCSKGAGGGGGAKAKQGTWSEWVQDYCTSVTVLLNCWDNSNRSEGHRCHVLLQSGMGPHHVALTASICDASK